MAILVEEKQSSVGFLGIVIWIVMLAMIGVGAYYIFFKSPTQNGDTVATPDSLEKSAEISKIKLDTKSVEDALKNFFNYVPWDSPKENKGRSNPFQSN